MSDLDKLYTRLKPIGKGSFGQVYKAMNNTTQEIVAIKEINLEADDDMEDLRKEISVLSSCDSPHMTRYHGSFLVSNKLWIVMDYCGIGSLRHLMKSGAIDEKYIPYIAYDVLDALTYLHKNNIIHRDIKAANILMTEDGVIKLCDFGVAGRLGLNQLKRNSFVGTPYWMAPEVILRSGYNYKADIWSFGITIYEIAKGHPPFIELDPMKAILLIPKSRPPQLEGDYSKGLKEFVQICLHENPEQRPSAEELMKHKWVKSNTKRRGILMELVNRHLTWTETHDINEKILDRNVTVAVKTAASWDFNTQVPIQTSNGGNSTVQSHPTDLIGSNDVFYDVNETKETVKDTAMNIFNKMDTVQKQSTVKEPRDEKESFQLSEKIEDQSMEQKMFTAQNMEKFSTVQKQREPEQQPVPLDIQKLDINDLKFKSISATQEAKLKGISLSLRGISIHPLSIDPREESKNFVSNIQSLLLESIKIIDFVDEALENLPKPI